MSEPSSEINYEVIHTHKGKPVKAWTTKVPFEEGARRQVSNMARMPFIFKHIAVMPDVHLGIGATVGSVIPTEGAIIPAAVGVDIGCGMIAARTDLKAEDLPDNLRDLREAIERAVPHGYKGGTSKGAWERGNMPTRVTRLWKDLDRGFQRIVAKHSKVEKGATAEHLGTLGSGNHFVEVCLDESNFVWFMLHSGSRGVGNRIGRYFIELAKKDMRRAGVDLPDVNLAYLSEGTEHFADYMHAVLWAQDFAAQNREVMMENVTRAARESLGRGFKVKVEAINCHHNYVQKETHFGREVYLTRKGAIRAGRGDMGIIPGSMGARSYIVRGLGNEDSFHSCSHGAGRVHSRTEAKRRYSLEDHARATEGVECRKDRGVLDETPMAYKDIDSVMESQKDLVEIVHTLKQVVCVKG